MQGCASRCRCRCRLLPLHRWCSSQLRRRRWPGGSAGESGRRRSEGCGRGSVAAVRLTTNRLHKTGYAVHHGFHNLT
jgi:hypothetical protein